MPSCWTCGAYVAGYKYTCSACETVSELKNLQKRIAFESKGITNKISDIQQSNNELAKVQTEQFRNLHDSFSKMRESLSDELSQISSTIEWGFEEINWELQQQTDVLKRIDRSLTTPIQTKAKELRVMAEELRKRGVLDKAEQFFLEALTSNPLDYRIYIGLAKTYLQHNRFDNAKRTLEESLPHAPHPIFESYSYRLIGHIYACGDDYRNAARVLRTAIELSPSYGDGHYDYAQYCSRIGDLNNSLSSLKQAIFSKPLYWSLAKREKNFDPFRKDVEKILSQIYSDATSKARTIINNADIKFQQLLKLIPTLDEPHQEILNNYNHSKDKLITAKEKLNLGDYASIFEVQDIAHASENSAIRAIDMINGIKERKKEIQRHEQQIRDENLKKTLLKLSGFLFKIFIGIGIIFFAYVKCSDNSSTEKTSKPVSTNSTKQKVYTIGVPSETHRGEVYTIKFPGNKNIKIISDFRVQSSGDAVYICVGQGRANAIDDSWLSQKINCGDIYEKMQIFKGYTFYFNNGPRELTLAPARRGLGIEKHDKLIFQGRLEYVEIEP